MMKHYRLFLFAMLPFLISFAVNRDLEKSDSIRRLKFLSAYSIPFNKQFQNTTIGGLSGIDYNPQKKEYYFISDDRSYINPARFYKADIVIKNDKIDSVVFLQTFFLKDAHGNFYPNSQHDPSHTPDPEALRFDVKNKTFIWSSEGERIVNSKSMILENPAVTQIDLEGNFIDTFQLPFQLRMTAKDFGPRQNGVFEGLTFTDDYRTLFVSVEEPLYQDGPPAGTGDSTGIVRFIKWDMGTKKTVAEYAYKIDPVAYAPIVPSAFKINGISDILSVGKNKFLVIERSYSTGRLSCTIKVFLADITNAENIDHLASLKNKSNIKMISKKLLLNMDDLGIYIDNIEGVTFGPILSNGKRSLIFIADNNFNPLAKNQFLLFQLIEIKPTKKQKFQ
jgi:hypothetical protein